MLKICRRLRQENCLEFETSLGNLVTKGDLVSKF